MSRKCLWLNGVLYKDTYCFEDTSMVKGSQKSRVALSSLATSLIEPSDVVASTIPLSSLCDGRAGSELFRRLIRL